MVNNLKIIDKDTSYIKEKNLLSLKVDLSGEANGILIYIFGMILTGTILLSFWFSSKAFFFFFILFLIFILPATPGYFYYRNRIIVWKFDVLLKKIEIKKLSPKFKPLKQYKFSHIKFLFYLDNYYGFSLYFYLDNSKKIKICSNDKKEDCEVLGKVIAKFMNRSFYHRIKRKSMELIYNP